MPVSSDKGNQTWGLEVPYHWRDYSAWRLIAELCRRHPGRFTVSELRYTSPWGETPLWTLSPSGTYEIGTPNSIGINSGGSVTIWSHNPRCPQGDEEPFEHRHATLGVMFSNDLEGLVRDVEGCAGFESPSKSAHTVRSTIGARFIAESLGLFLHSRTHLRVHGMLLSGEFHRPEINLNWSRELSAASLSSMTEEQKRAAWSSTFVLFDDRNFDSEKTPVRRPVIAVDVASGFAFTTHRTLDLMDRYEECDRDITRMAFELIIEARAETKGVNNGSI